MNNDNDSVAACMDHILMALNMIADMAQNDPKRRGEIAVEEIGLCQIISRTELILDLIDAKRPTRLRATSRSMIPPVVRPGATSDDLAP